MSWAIGVDFGTSRSAGALGEPNRHARSQPSTADLASIMVSPLEIEGNRWVASMVLRTPEGELVLGTAADNLAGVYPDRLNRTPKRSLGSGAPLLLGGEPIDARDAAAAVIRTIVDEGRLRSGGVDPESAVLTHPVRWADVRRDALREAGERAGLRDIMMVEEPVAAAIHYAAEHVPIGAHVGVYDLGGGTFDTAVLQRTDDGFEVIGVPGGDENIGGEDFDHRLFRFFGATLAESAPDVWEQMLTSEERKWKRAALDLLVQARRAKEALSAYTSTQVFVPVADRDITINRSQFEAMIFDDVERTVDMMEETVIDAGLAVDDLTSVFLVGGSSRLPLVAQMMTERFGARVETRDEPKAVVALGAARLAARHMAARAKAEPANRTAEHAVPAGDEPVALGWLDRLPPPRTEERVGAGAAAVDPRLLAALPPPPTAGIAGLDAMPPPPMAHAANPAAAPAPSTHPLPAQPPPPSVPPVGVPNQPPPPSVPPVGVPNQPPPPGPAAGARPPAGPVDPPRVAPPGPPVAPPPGPPNAVNVAWRVPLGAAPGQIAADLEAIAFGGTDGVVRLVDPRNGRVLWQVNVGFGVWAAPALTPDAVVVAALDGRVVSLDRRSGTVRWNVATQSPIAAAPAVVAGTVVAGNDAGRVLGLDTATGSLRWDLPLGAAVRAGVVPAGSGAIVATATGQVFSVDVATGACRWAYRTAGSITDSPGVVGDRVLVAGRDGFVHGLDAASGAVAFGVRCAGPVVTSVATSDTAFAVVDAAGVVRVHRADTGQPIAELTVRASQPAGLVLAPPRAPRSVLVETGSGDVVAADLATRNVLFTLPTGEGNRLPPVLSGGLAVVGTTFGQLYGIIFP